MSTSPFLAISKVGIDFPTPTGSFTALKDVDFHIDEGEFVSIIGHSGCGKSTVLNIIAGLYQSTSGGVILEGREVNEPGPDRAVVFQSHALMPWLSVYQNVALGVEHVFKGTKNKIEMREWVEHNLELVEMDHAMNKLPHEISGGMKQRVGIARCLAMQPKVMLMDEPFGALDAMTRANLQDSVMEIQKELHTTIVLITHDVDEAVLMSDKIIMMSNGPAAKVGEELTIELERPRDRISLSKSDQFNFYRQQVLSFLYEKKGVVSISEAKKRKQESAVSGTSPSEKSA
ncbi:MAG: ABC transporter ATP-binding protein [Gammaproteobacteria bacterium]|nr:ABC transporter ATP-binding protein [Gammaproteobacteria bacterium]